MTRIFTENSNPEKDGMIVLTGDNANHISRSLRMRAGEKIIVCDGVNTEYNCTIEGFTSDTVSLRVDSKNMGINEPDYKATLFMALPKSDKMEQIIQKSVETGVSCVVPFISSRCISKPDEKAIGSKLERWRKIARSASEQCGRVRIPEIVRPVDFSAAVGMMCDKNKYDASFICYECERDNSLTSFLSRIEKNANTGIAFMVGAEGGFSPSEVALTDSFGIERISLGRRILRCETAPIYVLSVMSALLEK